MRKKVVFIADSLDNAHRFQQVLSALNVDVAAGSTVQLGKLLSAEVAPELVIFEARGNARSYLGQVVQQVEDLPAPLLLIVNEEELPSLQFPTTVVSDFVMHGASVAECTARVKRLMTSQEEPASLDCISVDGLVINLATYQVTINGEPIDFTYLEYALLSFLAKHPGRTFSRDALLQRVWGFDYYGGSRTVDVHVRRIRSKLGPDLAERLETVRGVGYLWNA